MSYLINKSRGANVTINGVDYTRNLTQISISDDSIRGSGIIATSGTITLSQPFGEAPIDDYAKTKFLRGHVVIIDIKNPNGTTTRHPRGYLYVIESSYDPEGNILEIEIGCKLYLASISDNLENLLSLTTFTLPENQQDYSTLSAAIEIEGKIVYQDKFGVIQKIDFFDGDGSGAAVAPGEWVSIFGSTTLSVTALGGTTIVPDKIELTYQVSNAEEGTTPNRIDTVETTSNYYLTYPATIWERVRPAAGLNGVSGTGTTSTPPTTSRTSDDCGSSPIAPDTGTTTGTTETCSEGYTTVPYKTTSAVTSIEVSTSWYDGPGNQLSVRKNEKWGPAVELNSQYYADLYAFCVWGYSSACNPSGGCPLTGLAKVYHGYSQTTYTYGTGGETLKTVTENYENTISAAKPEDWRAGASPNNGTIEFAEFRSLSTSNTYLSKRTIVDYEYYSDRTIETTTAYTAPTEGSSGVGISSSTCYDASCGVITTERRISTTTNGPDAPDSASESNNINTTTFVIDEVRSPANYVSPPDETNPIVQKVQLQLTLDGAGANTTAGNYLRYLRKMIEGDSAGVRIVEVLRDDIVTNWRPGMPFRYYDPRVGKILALRMNACSWAMDADESVVAVDGIFLGLSNGTVAEPNNLVGNDTRPELSDAPLAVISAASISGTEMTVTSMQSGTIQVGSILSGEGIPEGTYVVSFISGQGGTGTYTISTSVTFTGVIYIYSTVPSGDVVPVIEDESGLLGASFAEVIKVNFYLRSLFTTGGGDNGYGVITAPGSQYVDQWGTWVCHVSGGLYAPGGLLSSDPSGGVPLSNGNVLMTASAVAVDPDLFT